MIPKVNLAFPNNAQQLSLVKEVWPRTPPESHVARNLRDGAARCYLGRLLVAVVLRNEMGSFCMVPSKRSLAPSPHP